MKQTHKEEETERKTHKDDDVNDKNTTSSLLFFVHVFFPLGEFHRATARNAPNFPPELPPMAFILRYVLK
jgi:hypothetical protein